MRPNRWHRGKIVVVAVAEDTAVAVVEGMVGDGVVEEEEEDSAEDEEMTVEDVAAVMTGATTVAMIAEDVIGKRLYAYNDTSPGGNSG